MTSNLATVQGIYEAFGRFDIPAILAQIDEDVVWEDGASDHGVPWLTPGRGVAHVGAFFASLAALDFTKFAITSICDGGDTVVAILDAAATVKATGATFDNIEAHIWRFNAAGKVCSFNHLVDSVQHLRAFQGAA